MQRFFLTCAITLVFFPSCRGHVPWRDDPAIFAAPSVIFHYREDFRNGEVNGWDSYPPAQDTAFDPTFGCEVSKTGAALQKRVTLNVDGPAEAGVIKKIACDVGPHATVRFRAEIRSTSPTVSIAVTLCAADGRRLTALTTAPIDRWSTLTLRGSDFGIAVPTRIQAVIISAVVNKWLSPDSSVLLPPFHPQSIILRDVNVMTASPGYIAECRMRVVHFFEYHAGSLLGRHSQRNASMGGEPPLFVPVRTGSGDRNCRGMTRESLPPEARCWHRWN